MEQEEPGKRASGGRGGVGGGERGAVVGTGGGLNRGDIADGGRESDGEGDLEGVGGARGIDGVRGVGQLVVL